MAKQLLPYGTRSQEFTAEVSRESIEPNWLGSKKDPRLYWTVRMEKQKRVREKYDRLRTFFDEPTRRLWAANEAISFGRGGIRAVAEALDMSQETVLRGIRELKAELVTMRCNLAGQGRQRRPGGGRKSIIKKEPAVVHAIEEIVTGNVSRVEYPMPLKWTVKSLAQMSAELKQRGLAAGPTTIGKILREVLGYKLHGLKNAHKGPSQPDPASQFEYLNRTCKRFEECGQPVIYVDVKKRLADQNERWRRVGLGPETVAFVATAILLWWTQEGQHSYFGAEELLIVAEGCGINQDQAKPWLSRLEKISLETGIAVTVCDFPPGTCKWSNVVHRLSNEMVFDVGKKVQTRLRVTIDLVGRASVPQVERLQAPR